MQLRLQLSTQTTLAPGVGQVGQWGWVELPKQLAPRHHCLAQTGPLQDQSPLPLPDQAGPVGSWWTRGWIGWQPPACLPLLPPSPPTGQPRPHVLPIQRPGEASALEVALQPEADDLVGPVDNIEGDN